jgi:hypothetical protein
MSEVLTTIRFAGGNKRPAHRPDLDTIGPRVRPLAGHAAARFSMGPIYPRGGLLSANDLLDLLE